MNHVVDSPFGPLRLSARGGALVALAPAPDATPDPPPEDPVLAEAARQLAAWFAGERTTFELPLALEGTAFQRQVWEALLAVPFGHTCSYADIAARIGRPTATRAVGAANGRNPLMIVVPCHRVIGRDGSLTGYAGGLDLKRRLLEHEGVRLAVSPRSPATRGG